MNGLPLIPKRNLALLALNLVYVKPTPEHLLIVSCLPHSSENGKPRDPVYSSHSSRANHTDSEAARPKSQKQPTAAKVKHRSASARR
jgi:hypothetical protein